MRLANLACSARSCLARALSVADEFERLPRSFASSGFNILSFVIVVSVIVDMFVAVEAWPCHCSLPRSAVAARFVISVVLVLIDDTSGRQAPILVVWAEHTAVCKSVDVWGGLPVTSVGWDES